MKKIIIALAAPLIMILGSCGNSNKDTDASLEGMKEIKLVILDDSLSLWVPSTVQGTLEITQQPWGATEIKIGTKFQLSIEQKEGDITLQKSDIEGNDVYKLQRFITDEPELLFWESKIPDMEQSNYHFYLVHKLGNIPYEIKDIDSGEAYSENDVKAMLEAAKTLKAKNQVEENS